MEYLITDDPIVDANRLADGVPPNTHKTSENIIMYIHTH